jgi:hypothetical protein
VRLGYISPPNRPGKIGFAHDRSGLAFALAALLACRGGGGKVHRTGSNAPVEVIEQSTTADAGAGVGTSDEVEPNDADDVATPLPLGGKVRGKIDPETDLDHYRLDITKAGALQLTISAVDMDLVLELEDGAGNVLARSARGGTRIVEGIPNFGVTPGRYTAVVRAAPKKKLPPPRRGRRPAPEPPKPPAPVYELSAVLHEGAPAAGLEREPDDDRGTANDLLPKDSVGGFIGWQGDQDMWKLSTETLSAKDAVELAVAPVEGIVLELEVQDALGTTLLAHKGNRGDGVSVHNLVPAVAPGAPPFVYLVVRADHSNPETAYQLKTSQWAPNLDDEAEPNDSTEHAFTIAADRTVVHAWWEAGDTDCFAAAPAVTARAVDFTVDTPAELDFAAEMFIDGRTVAKADHPGKGVAEKVGALVPAGSRGVVCVRAAREGPGRTKIGYDVHVQETTASGDNAP